MTPREVLEHARGERFADGRGRPLALEILPGLSDDEAHAFEQELGAPLPAEVADLLRFSRGFSLPPYEVSFVGSDAWGWDDAFPRAVPLAGNGSGDFWVVDVHPVSGAWGPVFFASHDPPVVFLQSPDLAAFVEAVLDTARPDKESALDRASGPLWEIWGSGGALISPDEAASSGDDSLTRFAHSLPAGWQVADLRDFREGAGFSWGHNGPDTGVRRDPAGERLFGVEAPRPCPPRRGLWQRLFGR
ncbi:MAG TPA: SMI1/KNR4 family protein [Longimicrobiaceae bacterium]|nr:SMI1/KNR4 family protein [Longimicrobiaceae bacterium]